MAIDTEELLPRKTKSESVIGEDLSALSVVELEARIAALEDEIERTQLALQSRVATKSAAENVFKR